MRRMTIGLAGWIALTAAVLVANSALAQTYPSRPIRIVVGFPPGGGSDLLARTIAPALGDELKATVIVENKVGAGGIIGTEYVARSPADGYTMYVATPGAFTIAPNIRKLSYDPVRDFQPIGRMVTWPAMLLVSPNSGFADVADLIAKAKANPGKLNYASSGSGTIGQLAAEYFNLLAGVRIQHIPYKGTAPALTGVMAGEAPIMFSDPAVPQVQAGKVRALAVTSAKRSGLFPDLPTIAELGVPGYDVMNWSGLLGPAGIPAKVTDQLSQALAKVMVRKEVVDRVTSIGMEAAYSTAAEFGRFIAAERAKWADVVKRANITVD